MTITALTEDNFEKHLEDAISLSDEFLGLVNEGEERTPEQKRKILWHMLTTSQTTFLLVQDENGAAIGMSYYNFGTGYACGGLYLWLNGIYIRPQYQKRGYGSRLLEYMIEDGRRQGMTLFLCSRHTANMASHNLFRRAGFTENVQTYMGKTY